MGDSLLKKTLSGMLWTFGQKFSIELFAFIQGIILARLLAPAEFGLIAMTQVFFAISFCRYITYRHRSYQGTRP